jgi:hypothetical protein
MAYEFNRDQFICNTIIGTDNIQDVSFNDTTHSITLTDNTKIDLPNDKDLYENCKLMHDYHDKQRSDLGYVDATNIQQRTWLHIANLIGGSAVLLYAIKQVMTQKISAQTV